MKVKGVQFIEGAGKPYKVQKRGPHGKMITQSFSTLDLAMAFAKKIEAAKEAYKAGIDAPQESVLFGDFAPIYMQKRKVEHAKGEISASTIDLDARNLALHWLAEFRDKPMNFITSRMIAEHLDKKVVLNGMSNAFRNRQRALISTFFNYAIRDGRYSVKENPARMVPLLSEKKKTRPLGFWKYSEQVEAYIKAAYDEGPNYGLIATIQLFAGPRISETLALRNESIDLENDAIIFDSIYEKVSNSIVSRLKGEGEGGVQAKPLFPRVKEAIERHWRDHARHKDPGDFLIHKKDGSFICYDTFKEAHRRILKASGVQRITIHDMRRTCAVQMRRAGHSEGDVQVQLGHGSIKTTENYLPPVVSYVNDRARKTGFGQSLEPSLEPILMGIGKIEVTVASPEKNPSHDLREGPDLEKSKICEENQLVKWCLGRESNPH